MKKELDLTSLDFDSIKSSLKSFMKTQDQFKDYDFEGSNLAALIDLLAYNTYMNNFMTNFAINEMFNDSAQTRNSIVSHAKELNYLPKSAISASAVVNITVNGGNTSLSTITIPKNTSFTARVGSGSYSFTTDSALVVGSTGNGVFVANNVYLYEGRYTTEAFVINDNQRYILNNRNIDTSSISVTVIEDGGATELDYIYYTSLFGVTSTTKAFFLQAADNERYEIIFGDGVIGRKPKVGAVCRVSYRISSQTKPNGAFKFASDGSINGFSNVSIETVSAASGGAAPEDIESIRFNAPRHFQTQERAVTATDYEVLLKGRFAEINTVAVYGGEDSDPPQYGVVFIAVDIDDVDGLPDVKRKIYESFIRERSPLSIDPVFVTPEYMYLKVDTKIKYNINVTSLNTEEIKALVLSSINTYNENNLDDFKTTFRYSKFLKAIDDAHTSIISNETDVLLIKEITPSLGISKNYDVDFRVPLKDDFPRMLEVHGGEEIHAISSATFTLNGQAVNIEDDGDGNMRVVARLGVNDVVLFNCGTVDYVTGKLSLTNLKIDALTTPTLKIYGHPKNKDIESSRNTILTIRDEDTSISVSQMRE